MPRIKMQVVFKAEAPMAVLRSRTNSQFVKTLDYLPGSAVRGAFAEIFVNKIGVDANFRSIFVEEKVWFSDFLPSNLAAPPLLVPLTAVVCKRHGLAHPDSLQDYLLTELQQSHALPTKCLHSNCGEPLVRMKTDAYLNNTSTKEKVVFGKQLRMHVGMSRATGSAMSGLLFSYETLTQARRSQKDPTLFDLYFIGTLETEQQALFDVLKGVVPDREHLGIGKARTRGLGELSIASRQIIEEKNDLAIRLQDFQTNIPPEKSRDYFYFAITLSSHLAIKDKLGRPVLSSLNSSHLGLEDKPVQVECCATFAGTTVVAGWNAVQGLPKPDTHVISRGSVFAFRVKKSSAFEELVFPKLVFHLQNLERNGLGERRAEGFGQLIVCHPFHVNV